MRLSDSPGETAANASPGLNPLRLGAGNVGMLYDALNAAGVQLGACDRRIIDWLAGWSPRRVPGWPG